MLYIFYPKTDRLMKSVDTRFINMIPFNNERFNNNHLIK